MAGGTGTKPLNHDQTVKADPCKDWEIEGVSPTYGLSFTREIGHVDRAGMEIYINRIVCQSSAVIMNLPPIALSPNPRNLIMMLLLCTNKGLYVHSVFTDTGSDLTLPDQGRFPR